MMIGFGELSFLWVIISDNRIGGVLNIAQCAGKVYIEGLVQYCSNSIASTLELLQSCTKPLVCAIHDFL